MAGGRASLGDLQERRAGTAHPGSLGLAQVEVRVEVDDADPLQPGVAGQRGRERLVRAPRDLMAAAEPNGAVPGPQRCGHALRAGHRTIGLGGGHEIAWASYQALASALAGEPRLQRVGVVNFDAHFDLRQAERPGVGSSGTPFLQIAEARAAAGQSFSYLCLGISETANTQALFDRAKALGVRYVTDVEIDAPQSEQALRSFVAANDTVYCTFCLDVLPPAVAPGVSAPSGLGVPLHRAIALLRLLVTECRGAGGPDKLMLADVAEYSPPHDAPDGRTGRTAARIVYELAALHR